MAKGKKVMSRKERLKNKRECEKRRRERIKEDTLATEALKKLKHDIYVKAKKSGKVKMINELNPRGQRNIRKRWRENKKNKRKRDKEQEKGEKFKHNSPPFTENEDDINNDLQPQINISPCQISVNVSEKDVHQESSQKKRGRKTVRASCYRKLNTVTEENYKLKKKYENAKTRYHHLLKRTEGTIELMPKPKVSKILKGIHIDANVVEKLLFAEAIQLKPKSKYTLKLKQKQIFSKIVGGKIINKITG